jgi:TonB family protein
MMRIVVLLACVVVCLRCIASEAGPVTESANSAPSSIGGEPDAGDLAHTYTPPVVRIRKPPNYPRDAQQRGREGWVQMNMMVDPEGRPYEITVTNSLGDPAFRKAAVRAVEKWQFHPAVYGGKNIDGAVALNLAFRLEANGAGVRSTFASDWKRITATLDSVTLEESSAAIEALRPMNLYEEAYLALLRFIFARKYEGPELQKGWLDRALTRSSRSEEYSQHLLSDEAYLMGTKNLASLELQTQDYVKAMRSAEILLKLDITDEERAEMQKVIKKIEALREDDRAYSVNGEIGTDNRWTHWLLKNDFHLDVHSGEVAELKLLCDRKYVGIRFQQGHTYTVDGQSGYCQLHVIGNPGSRFELVQH